MKTIIKQFIFQIFRIILIGNLLSITFIKNVAAQIPAFTCSTTHTSYSHSITQSSATYDLKVCAVGDPIYITFTSTGACTSFDNLDWSWSTSCDVSGPSLSTQYSCTAVASGGTITASFSGAGCSSPYTVVINIHVAACPIFRAVTTTTFTGSGNIVLCDGLNSPCDLTVYVNDVVTFEILTNNSSASAVTFTSTYSCSGMPSGSQSLPVASWNCTFSTAGDYTVTATYSSCATCSAASIVIHVAKCPIFKAENLSNACTYPSGLTCSPSSTPCDMYVTVGDQLRFSVLTNYSHCGRVTFSSQYSGCTVPSASDLPISAYTCTFGTIGDYNISATFSNGTCSNVNPANTTTCNCGSNCTATITVHVLGAFEPAGVSATSVIANAGSCTPSDFANINNTGNDKRRFTISAVTYDVDVSVWDGGETGLGWRVNDGSNEYFGCINLNSADDAVDPDVCLVRGCHGSSCSLETFFAIVVYHSATETSSPGGYRWKAFYWDTSTNAFIEETGIGAQLLSTASFAHSINIDSDANENFAIVWDESDGGSSYDVYCNIGRGGAGLRPALLCLSSGSPDNFRVTEDGKMPDVSLFYRNSSTEKLRLVWATIISGGDGVKMNEANFSDISGNCTTAENYLDDVFADNVSGHVYSYPRIATPNSNGAVEQYCVVLKDFVSSGSHDYITGFTSSDGSTFSTPLKHTYNDGSAIASPADISLVPNNKPAVTFDNNGGYVYIGWTFDDDPSTPDYVGDLGAELAEYPIILVRDLKGETTQCLKYWNVPAELAGANERMRHLSLAGRDVTGRTLYTWFNDDPGGSIDILYKYVSQSTTPALRASPVAGGNEKTIPVLYPNPAGDELAITGLTGDCEITAYTVIGAEAGRWQMAEAGNNKIDIRNFKPGIYIFIIISLTEKTQWIQKIIKM